MQTAFVAVLLAAVVAARASVIPELFSEEHIRQVNSEASTWKAGKNFPDGTTEAHIKALLGVLPSSGKPLLAVREEEYDVSDDSIPESFDAREHWPKCAGIKQIADQSSCGSCWAVGAATAISDRICIHSDGAKQTLVSASDLMACCGQCGYGCNGGYPEDAWYYWVHTGIATGGAFNSKVGCKPYPFAPCAHHVNNTQYPACPEDMYKTPSCVHKCDGSLEYSSELIKGQKSYKVRGVQNIQKEILTNGPVEASFTVYADFPLYKSGVYKKGMFERNLGGHAVRLIGWGIEKNTPYWLVANSWNEGWGDNGLFKIARGHNECGFESEIVAGIPK